MEANVLCSHLLTRETINSFGSGPQRTNKHQRLRKLPQTHSGSSEDLVSGQTSGRPHHLKKLGTDGDKLKRAQLRKKVLVSTGGILDAAASASDTTQEAAAVM